METYFNAVVSNLTIEDSMLLGILLSNDATSKVKAMRGQAVFEKSASTEAKYRKMMDRLVALQFIIVVKDFKEHTLYISEFGVAALNDLLETMKTTKE